MGIVTILDASIKLGIPLAAMSWFIFHWLYSSGEIDREADRRVIKTKLKKMKKAFKNKESENKNFIYDKWTMFGSGFYGLAGLWTFTIIEIGDFFSFIWNFPGISVLIEDGLLDFIIGVLVNQLGNFVTALLWFGYWPGDEQSTLIWILIAYLGYWVGVEAARRGMEIPYKEDLEELPAKIKSSSPEARRQVFSSMLENSREWMKSLSSRFKKS